MKIAGLEGRIKILSELRKSSPEMEKSLSANLSRSDTRFRGLLANLACRALAWREFSHDLIELTRLGNKEAEFVLSQLGVPTQAIARLTNEKMIELQQRRNALYGLIKFGNENDLKKELLAEAPKILSEINDLKACAARQEFPLFSSLMDRYNEIATRLNSLRAGILSQYVSGKKPAADMEIKYLEEIKDPLPLLKDQAALSKAIDSILAEKPAAARPAAPPPSTLGPQKAAPGPRSIIFTNSTEGQAPFEGEMNDITQILGKDEAGIEAAIRRLKEEKFSWGATNWGEIKPNSSEEFVLKHPIIIYFGETISDIKAKLLAFTKRTKPASEPPRVKNSFTDGFLRQLGVGTDQAAEERLIELAAGLKEARMLNDKAGAALEGAIKELNQRKATCRERLFLQLIGSLQKLQAARAARDEHEEMKFAKELLGGTQEIIRQGALVAERSVKAQLGAGLREIHEALSALKARIFPAPKPQSAPIEPARVKQKYSDGFLILLETTSDQAERALREFIAELPHDHTLETKTANVLRDSADALNKMNVAGREKLFGRMIGFVRKMRAAKQRGNEGERAEAGKDLVGAVHEIIRLGSIAADRQGRGRLEAGKDLGSITFFLPEIVRGKDGEYFINGSKHSSSQTIDADGYLTEAPAGGGAQSRTLIEIKYCARSNWITGGVILNEEDKRMAFNMISQMRKYKAALDHREIKVDAVELYITAPSIHEQALDDLVAAFKQRARNLKIYLYPSLAVKEGELIFDGSKEA